MEKFKPLFKKEFERRLVRLHAAIESYWKYGNIGDLMPALFSVFSFLWTDKNARLCQ